MPFRCRVVLSCCWRSNIALLLVLWAVSPLSMGFAGCSVHTWHDRGRPGLVRRDHVTRWAGTGATAAFGVVDRNDGMVMSISSYSARSIGEKLEEMEQWLDESGVDRRGGGSGPPSARLRRFSGKGVGLEAGVELERDSTVASIPRRVCLSSDATDAPAGTLRAWAHALIASVPLHASAAAAACPEETNNIDFETDVAVVTLQVFLEGVLGTRSTCSPWMAMLSRKDELNLPALWPASDREALKGTLVLQEVEKCLAKAEVERDVVAAAIANGLRGDVEVEGGALNETHELPECRWFDAKEVEGRPTHAEWLHARCTVQSRAYRVGPRYLLIPLVDFANHDDDVAFAVCPGDGVFTGSDEVVFAADRAYGPGQEISTSYGDMDNAKRLFSFGFVTLNQPAPRSQPSPTENFPLPTEAFCDVTFDMASTDPLRIFKEGVIHELGVEAEDGVSSLLNFSVALSLTTPCHPVVSQLVEGPARLFVESIMPVVRLVALVPQEFFSQELALGDLCQPRRGSPTAAAGSDHSFESGVVDDRGDAFFPVLKVGKGNQVLERLGSRCSLDNDREALHLLAELCTKKLQTIDLSLHDVEALREVARESNESATFAASAPRSLLCATVRVAEAIAWHALLEACNKRGEGYPCQRIEQTWTSWVSKRCRGQMGKNLSEFVE